MKEISILFLIWNIVIVLMYATDKGKAKRGTWRISEFTLIIPAFLFGSLGAMLGMILFNHKTSKIKFRLLIPLAFVFNVALIYLISKILGR